MAFKRKLCKHCKGKLEPGQYIHPECIDPFSEAEAAKAERRQYKRLKDAVKAEKAQDRAKAEGMKSRQKWLAECQAIANKYARVRDADDGCISCDKPANWHGQWHGSHFRSVGAASAVRFNLWNIHKACSVCNHHLGGNLFFYAPRLIEKIGQGKVDWLLSQNQIVRHDIGYLKRYKQVIGKRLRRMERSRS